MLRRFCPSVSSRASVFITTTGSLSTATRFVPGVSHYRDFKETHPLQDVIPSVRRAGTVETVVAQDGRKLEYEYPCDHEIWSEEECRAVCDESRPRRSLLDSSAYWSIQLIRFSFDLFSGYKFGKLTKSKILRRVLFLETAAGIPGTVAGTLRHLKSLRTMKRDNGWIQTLLQEAENERMHMLVALHLQKHLGSPGFIMRLCVLITQGVMWNMFFIMYIITNGKWCHRFVGYLEESAVHTYIHAIGAMENPKNKELYQWGQEAAPEIAIKYWKLKADAKVLDVLLQMMADEDNHKKVNHTFADIAADQVNPYVEHGEAHRSLQEKIKANKQACQEQFPPRDPNKHDADPYFTAEELGLASGSSTKSGKKQK